jgi:hypothetical protein
VGLAASGSKGCRLGLVTFGLRKRGGVIFSLPGSFWAAAVEDHLAPFSDFLERVCLYFEKIKQYLRGIK